jgi:hypothetical protein
MVRLALVAPQNLFQPGWVVVGRNNNPQVHGRCPRLFQTC